MQRFTELQEKEKELSRRMRRLKIFEKDIKEKFIRSSGPGGQNVNKVATCVSLVHAPTNISVKCQTHRSQAANRHSARRLLADKIERQQKSQALRFQQAAAKKKRQNRKRSKRAKDVMLEQKHKHSEKKQQRQKIKPTRIDND